MFGIYFGWIIFVANFIYVYYDGNSVSTSQFDSFVSCFRWSYYLFEGMDMPEIFLPAIQQNRFQAIIFVIFMLLGIYLLLNLFTALVFSHFENRVNKKMEKKNDLRMDYLWDRYLKCGGSKGYLNRDELFKLFSHISQLAKGKFYLS